ncbi:indoleamine 2,3-dioxygenase alpha type [Geopyxis carbonaria]|nr:indoleamine 2,3-dioxygenase alpha type [Geopyxis carbonaria]
MIPPLPNLEDYQISPENGFLPAEPPIERLSDPYYEPWEVIVANLQALILTKQIRRAVEALPTLSTSRLQTTPEWRRAYMVLGFISNSYIWGMEQAEERVPQCISIPFLATSEYLEIPPVVTYAGVCLWNFRPVYPGGPIDLLENLMTLTTFTGSLDESWFYLVSVAIEARGAPTIPVMMEAMLAARNDDRLTVTECLTIFAERIMDLRSLLGRMYDNCSPQAFYFRIRPFLAGSKNMASAGLPNGVILEDGSGKEKYRQYSGGSNAQSSLIQFFDIALGVEHRPTGVKKDPSDDKKAGTPPPSRHNFIEEMRSYMPGPHRRFLEHLNTVANIKEYVQANADCESLSFAYDECLRALSSFRDKHLQIVSRYVVIMAQESKRRTAAAAAKSPDAIPEKVVSTNFLGLAKGEAIKGQLTGTGGTKLMPFLKQSRDETMEPATGAWSKTTSKFESFHARSASVTPSSTPSSTPRSNSPMGFAARSCKVNDFEDIPVPRVTGVGMAGNWEAGDDVGGICHC